MESSDSQPIIDAAQKFAGVEARSLKRGSADACDVLVLPAGKTIASLKKYLDEYLPKPERKRGTSVLTALDSFIDHVKRNTATGNTVVFCDDRDTTAPKLIAVYNYNGAAGSDAEFCDHRATYAFPLSEAWKAWTGIAGTEVSQAQLAAFFEERLIDVIDPETAVAESEAIKKLVSLDVKLANASALQALARGMTLTIESKVVNSVDLATGERVITFEEQHNGGKLKAPQAFAIGIPVFQNGERYPLAVRLRYRHLNGKILWTLLPLRPEQIFDLAVNGALSKVETFCGVPVFHGSPEA